MTATTATGRGCGCGGACGGAPATGAGGFVRPRFFAGLLLTEDDLEAITGYVTGKNRFHNRHLTGAGVVSGLDVGCDPCGGGTVTVRPGYAVDGRGNDIVVDCATTVDVSALVRDVRIGAIGTDCGCGDDGERGYGLYVSYAEVPGEPVMPMPSGHGDPGRAGASRIRESFRFSVAHLGPDDPDDEPYHPWQRITGRLGGRADLDTRRGRALRLQRYGSAATWAVRTSGREVAWTDDVAARYEQALLDLAELSGEPTGELVPRLVESVRALASGLARHALAPEPKPTPATGVEEAGRRLTEAQNLLLPLVTEGVFGDPALRGVATAVVTTPVEQDDLGLRMIALGTPLTEGLRNELAADAYRLRGWLLSRVDTDGAGSGCGLRAAVSGVTLPAREQDGPFTAADLSVLGRAAIVIGDGVAGYVTDTVCGSLQPPAPVATDAPVLLARVTLRDCDVETVCTTGRRQASPGGPGYAAWAGVVARARTIAAELRCRPVSSAPGPDDGTGPGIVADLPYPRDLLVDWTLGALRRLLDLLDPDVEPAIGRAAAVAVPAAPGPAGIDETARADDAARDAAVAELRGRVDDLTALRESVGDVAELRERVDEVAELRENVGDVAELRERVGDVAELRERVDEVTALRERVDELTRLVERLQSAAETATDADTASGDSSDGPSGEPGGSGDEPAPEKKPAARRAPAKKATTAGDDAKPAPAKRTGRQRPGGSASAGSGR